jgi:uncharacterized protein (DUF1330 family)
MPAYIIALINIKDPEKYQEYAKRAGPAGAKHGGKFLVRGGAKTPLEGDIPFQRIVVDEFKDVRTRLGSRIPLLRLDYAVGSAYK